MNAREADRFARRLAGYGLGVGAVAAGLTLPQKAEASIIYEPTIGVTVYCNWDVAWIRFSGMTGLVAGSGSCWAWPAFNFQYLSTGSGFVFQGGLDCCYNYAILEASGAYGAHLFSAPDSTFDLSNINTVYFNWATSVGYTTYLPMGSPRIVGLRMQYGGDSYYGWVELERGSVSINEGAFNDASGSPMYPGQIPEPGSLLLMLSGAAGLSALRKRRSGQEE